ncbi:MAG: hypothetical protein ACFCU8_04035, partial [Thermosynechococcaceae cyanobacterium]
EVAIAEAELAWPDLQVALLLSESELPIFEQAGWQAQLLSQVVTDPHSFYSQVLSSAEEAA